MANRAKSIHPLVGKKIKQMRLEADMTQKTLAERLGKSESAVRMWELGKSEPDIDTLRRVADLFGVATDDLLGKPSQKETSNLGTVLQGGIRMIPVYESVSAGFGAAARDDIIDYLPCYIPNDAEAEETLCIKVRGDSMYPKIEDGDVIQVRKQASVDSGSVAVILLDGEEGLVKRVVFGKNWLELQSINPMYPPMRFEGAEAMRVQIIGLVRKIIKDI